MEELTKSSFAEAAAKSAPFLVIVAVLELLDCIVIVPLTESVGSLKTMSVRRNALYQWDVLTRQVTPRLWLSNSGSLPAQSSILKTSLRSAQPSSRIAAVRSI